MSYTKILLTVVALITSWAIPAAAGPPLIDNPQQAPIQRTIPMTEVWRIGDHADESFVLGVIKRIISDEEGNFYLLDSQQSEVFKFSAEGQYLKSVSRKGEGPGEIGRCHFFGFWDQETIACFSNFPHKFVRFDREGLPVATLTPSPGVAQRDVGSMGMSRFERRVGFLVAQGSFFRNDNGKSIQKFFLSGFDDGAQETICYGKVLTGYDFSRPVTVDEKADFIALRRWTLGREGELYTAPQRTSYLIEVHDSQGNLLRTISRRWPLHKRTAAEKEAAKNRYSFGVAGNKMPPITYKIDDYAHTIAALNWIDDQLWVTATAPRVEGKSAVSIFDREGNLMADRVYELPWDPEKDKVHWLDGGRAVVVKNYASASVASRGANTTHQKGDGTQEISFDDDLILEVILYQAKN